VYVEEYAEERWRVELAEAAAEGGGRTDGAEEGRAGESCADEAREGGEVKKYLAQEVVAEVAYGGGSGWRWRGFFLERRRGRRRRRRRLRGHVGCRDSGNEERRRLYYVSREPISSKEQAQYRTMEITFIDRSSIE
jgi:hypothetical protein